MNDALDRVAPEDRKGTLYRHSAEGLDDMPVSGDIELLHVMTIERRDARERMEC